MTPWQFWIDVGGTFTDCVARPPVGRLLRYKTLSSGVTKGVVAAGSACDRIVDPRRVGEPADLWTDYEIRLTDDRGQTRATARVAAGDPVSGLLWLAEPLPVAPREGDSYELASGEEAPLVAIRHVLGLPLSATVPPVIVRLGTTRGTNALLTRSGPLTALVTTRGFADVLRIGNQNRPRLFELCIHKPRPLFATAVEIDERVDAAGQVLRCPRRAEVRAVLERLPDQGIESLAVCLLHAHQRPEHEQLVAEVARELGFDEISLSHDVAPLRKLVARGDTTVVDAYLQPVLRRYVAGLRARLPGSDLRLLTSAGGLVAAELFRGRDSVLSGPAGGVVGYSRIAVAAGFPRAIGFDMGGTSTDVSRYDGRYEMQYETEKAGVRIVAPMMAIETVAAGGGSICHFDGVQLRVGPASAGADPGPACYGRGGPLTLTDVNLLLGRIRPDQFPFPLDRDAAACRLSELADQLAAASGGPGEQLELAEGLCAIANANMARAIRSISVARGYDPRDDALVAFGGAAPQHACDVAAALGMTRVLVHPDAGLLSAYGIGLADVARHRVAPIYQPFSADLPGAIHERLAPLAAAARREIEAEGMAPTAISESRWAEVRYLGTDAGLTVPLDPPNSLALRFAAEHRRRYGYEHPGRALEVVTAGVEVVGRSGTEVPPSRRADPRPRVAPQQVAAFFQGELRETGLCRRHELSPGDLLAGPALVVDDSHTTVVAPHWQAELLTGGELLLTPQSRSAAADRSLPAPTVRPAAVEVSDPVQLEIFNNHFAAIAEQMGIVLRHTASSVNVKERLDFSCALFTSAGELVVNAPHIPVHLGAMSETVKWILRDNPRIVPGDVFLTNDPYRGGSHLPDVTVVTPVFVAGRADTPTFFTANRAHHAEIGGITPGSMPPFSRTLAEEGVLIRNFKLVSGGVSRFEALGELLTRAPYPSRNVSDNLADVAAQVAANQQGARDLGELLDRYGLSTVAAYMGHIQTAAETKLRRALARIAPGPHAFRDHLDDGTPIQVQLVRHGESLTIDFQGTGPVHAGNLNANRAIVMAAVLYVLRLLIDEDIPLNEGVLKPVTVVLPECLLNPPARESAAECAAVVGGNVETSQRVVDCLLGALGLAAASQGTMNNVVFGDATFGYYETLCGGAGATPAGDGADAVHTHMTNTRLTDPEVLEQRFPVRLWEFAIRRGSGGRGAHRGGDGVVRRIEFLRPLDLSLVSQRRGPYPPYGAAGGEPGALGIQQLLRRDGRVERLPALAHCRVEPGDLLSIATPGGGGYGRWE